MLTAQPSTDTRTSTCGDLQLTRSSCCLSRERNGHIGTALSLFDQTEQFSDQHLTLANLKGSLQACKQVPIRINVRRIDMYPVGAEDFSGFPCVISMKLRSLAECTRRRRCLYQTKLQAVFTAQRGVS